MNRITILLLSLLVACGLYAKGDKGAVITMTETAYDFGEVAEKGGPVTHEFEFTNTGTAPLVIISASASCGCTTPKYPEKPIQPGKTGKITVTYNPNGRPGSFTKTVTVTSNSVKDKKTKLKISGTVKH